MANKIISCISRSTLILSLIFIFLFILPKVAQACDLQVSPNQSGPYTSSPINVSLTDTFYAKISNATQEKHILRVNFVQDGSIVGTFQFNPNSSGEYYQPISVSDLKFGSGAAVPDNSQISLDAWDTNSGNFCAPRGLVVNIGNPTQKVCVLETSQSAIAPGMTINVTIKDGQENKDYLVRLSKQDDGVNSVGEARVTITIPSGQDTASADLQVPNSIDTSKNYILFAVQGINQDCQPIITFTAGTGTLIAGPGGLWPGHCGTNNNGVPTALGCIDTDTAGFINGFSMVAFGLGFGIAFLMMVFGAIKILTSSGNPEGVNSGREIIISALTGLLFMIFGVFLLKLIGFTIFNFPIPT